MSVLWLYEMACSYCAVEAVHGPGLKLIPTYSVYLWSASHCGQCYFVGGQYADHVVSSHDGFCCITDDTG